MTAEGFRRLRSFRAARESQLDGDPLPRGRRRTGVIGRSGRQDPLSFRRARPLERASHAPRHEYQVIFTRVLTAWYECSGAWYECKSDFVRGFACFVRGYKRLVRV